jgi:hypothetical protein
MKRQMYSAVHMRTIVSGAGAARSELRAGLATAGRTTARSAQSLSGSTVEVLEERKQQWHRRHDSGSDTSSAGRKAG